MKLFQQPKFSWKQPGLHNKFAMSQKTKIEKLLFWGANFALAVFLSLIFVAGLALVAKIAEGNLRQPNLIFFFVVIFVVLSIGFIIQNTRTSTIYIREDAVISSRGFRLKFYEIRDFSLVPMIFSDERVLLIVFNCQNDEHYWIEVPNSISKNDLLTHLSNKVTYVPSDEEIILG